MRCYLHPTGTYHASNHDGKEHDMTSIRNRATTVALCVIACMSIIGSGANAQTAPVGTSECPDVRPGAHVTTSNDTGGTLNFLFKGSDGHRYVGTAGHLLADEQTLTWKGDGPTATIDDGTTIGRAVFASNHNAGDDDFALIKLGRKVEADPAVCHWGGPTSLYDESSSEPTVLRLYGNGQGIKEAVPARSMLAPHTLDEHIVTSIGAVAPGDSGSPVITEDGRAVGLQFLLGTVFPDPANPTAASPGTVVMYRLGPQVELAERALRIELELMTAPLAES